jgi:RND family efflux transporter MFP subunit
MTKHTKPIAFALSLVVLLGLSLWLLLTRFSGEKSATDRKETAPIPVAVENVELGSIEWRRTLSGSLESPGQFVVAPKISGRVVQLAVDLGDDVTRGKVVARLDNDEYVQAVAQAKADLAVAKANLVEAQSGLDIAERELKRAHSLRAQNIGSESEFDVAQGAQLGKQAAVKVAEAQVTRFQAALNAANIRLSYTKIVATWTGGDDQRVIAERHVDEGDTVAANTPLFTIVELDPITAVVHLTAKDYARMEPGLRARLMTDAYPGRIFPAQVTRVAPIFQESSRQARAELTVANPEHKLKPGMFVRVEAVLDRAEKATIVPRAALTTRNGQTGVFVVKDDMRVAWRPVKVAIEETDRVQVVGDGITGRVVTLGQQLIEDGSRIILPTPAQATTNPGSK